MVDATKEILDLTQEELIPVLAKHKHIDHAIEFNHFYFKYHSSNPGLFSLKDITVRIDKGSTVLIGGISGSGKSTLCKAIAGEIPHKIAGQMSGTIDLFNKNIWEFDEADLTKNISYIYQNAEEQLVTFTVFDEIAFALENLKISPHKIKDRVYRIAEQLGIRHLLDRSIYELSGGEKQKVVIASHLIMDPQILILDEPLAFLDESGERLLRNTIQQLRKTKPDLTIIIVEHRLIPFYDIIDNILLLNKHGEMSFFGNVAEYETYNKTQVHQYLRDTLYENKNENVGYPTQNNREPIVSFNNVSFSYPSTNRQVFSQLDLMIYEKEFLGVVGDNGSGKTTLLYLIAHMLTPEDGDRYFQTIPYNELVVSDFIPHIGFIFQNPEDQLFENTVEKEMMYALTNFHNMNNKNRIALFLNNTRTKIDNFRQIRGKINHPFNLMKKLVEYGHEFLQKIGKTQVWKKCKYYLFHKYQVKEQKRKWFEQQKTQVLQKYLPLIGEFRQPLTEVAKKNPFKLSWGQKRRLNLASIFSYEPELLLIDEPFIGQDAASINRIMEILHQFHQQGKTIVIVSHDRGLLQHHCSRILNLEQINPREAKISTKSDSSELKESSIRTNKKKKKNGKSKSKKEKRLINMKLYLQNPDESLNNHNFIHNLHPMVKLCFLILFTISLFKIQSILIYLLLFGFLMAFAKLSQIPLQELTHRLKWIFILTFLYIPLNTLFDAQYSTNSEVLFYIITEKLPVRRIALYYSLRNGLLIISLFTSAMIFTQTTTPKNIVYGFMQVGIPYRFAFAFMIGMRYIPLIEKESNNIELAQTLRGLGINRNSTLRQVFRHIYQRISTLMVNIIRKAHTTANAIDSRAFGLYRNRTNIYQIQWQKKDWLVTILGLCVFTFSILLLNNLIFSNVEIPALYDLFLSLKELIFK